MRISLGLALKASSRGVISAAKNTVAPAFTGTPEDGQTGSLSTGTWTLSNGVYERRYLRSGVLIQGATLATYDFSAGDVGFLVRGEVRTFDSSGIPTAWVPSNDLGPVAVNPVPSSALINAAGDYVVNALGDYIISG